MYDCYIILLNNEKLQFLRSPNLTFLYEMFSINFWHGPGSSEPFSQAEIWKIYTEPLSMGQIFIIMPHHNSKTPAYSLNRRYW